ncbi:unnamed protein product [Zymoseptoria tritici ST99CH_1E4]|uniref:DUF396-domain-containing protein n=1 Tax=Zymoseptoria tritici ST99CH_1E4 TaxID=1276532 RepID=A0A2H1GN53_ZYMTR|nr:unnamed protein product [Zymoseptoria tritici ST99CH_1E4]
MWILPLLGYLGLALGFLFLTLAIASGLYYLSELVEEHSVIAKRILTRLIYFVIGLQVLLLVVDKFPPLLSIFSIASHIIYSLNLRRFPVVKLTDPVFLASCALVLANHWLWFRHFSNAPGGQNHRGASSARWNVYERVDVPTFTEIASFFGLNVWLVPFALFVSLSAGENVLPSMGSEYATGQGSSFVSAGAEPSGMSSGGYGGYAMPGGGGAIKTRHKRSNTQTGMAKAAVMGDKTFVMKRGVYEAALMSCGLLRPSERHQKGQSTRIFEKPSAVRFQYVAFPVAGLVVLVVVLFPRQTPPFHPEATDPAPLAVTAFEHPSPRGRISEQTQSKDCI